MPHILNLNKPRVRKQVNKALKRRLKRPVDSLRSELSHNQGMPEAVRMELKTPVEIVEDLLDRLSPTQASEKVKQQFRNYALEGRRLFEIEEGRQGRLAYFGEKEGLRALTNYIVNQISKGNRQVLSDFLKTGKYPAGYKEHLKTAAIRILTGRINTAKTAIALGELTEKKIRKIISSEQKIGMQEGNAEVYHKLLDKIQINNNAWKKRMEEMSDFLKEVKST